MKLDKVEDEAEEEKRKMPRTQSCVNNSASSIASTNTMDSCTNKALAIRFP